MTIHEDNSQHTAFNSLVQPVLIPEPISVSNPFELFHDNGTEQLSGPLWCRLQHTSWENVYIIEGVAIQSAETLDQLQPMHKSNIKNGDIKTMNTLKTALYITKNALLFCLRIHVCIYCKENATSGCSLARS